MFRVVSFYLPSIRCSASLKNNDLRTHYPSSRETPGRLACLAHCFPLACSRWLSVFWKLKWTNLLKFHLRCEVLLLKKLSRFPVSPSVIPMPREEAPCAPSEPTFPASCPHISSSAPVQTSCLPSSPQDMLVPTCRPLLGLKHSPFPSLKVLPKLPSFPSPFDKCVCVCVCVCFGCARS